MRGWNGPCSVTTGVMDANQREFVDGAQTSDESVALQRNISGRCTCYEGMHVPCSQ